MNVEGPGSFFPAVEALLNEQAPITRRWSGPAFRFPEKQNVQFHAVRITEGNAQLLDPLMSAWKPDIHECPPLFAVVIEGRAVSICGSVRRSSVAHEAGVETAETFRGRGFGANVVMEWAAAVASMGRVPLYSTSWENVASLALAHRLKLVQFASDFHVG